MKVVFFLAKAYYLSIFHYSRGKREKFAKKDESKESLSFSRIRRIIINPSIERRKRNRFENFNTIFLRNIRQARCDRKLKAAFPFLLHESSFATGKFVITFSPCLHFNLFCKGRSKCSVPSTVGNMSNKNAWRFSTVLLLLSASSEQKSLSTCTDDQWREFIACEEVAYSYFSNCSVILLH